MHGLGLTYLRRSRLDRAEEFFDQAYQASLQAPIASDVTIGRSMLYLGTLYLEQRLLDRAEECLLRSYEVLSGKVDAQRDLLVVINNLYLVKLMQGDFAQAETLIKRASTRATALYPKSHPLQASLFYNIGAFYYYAKNDSQATLHYTKQGLDSQAHFLQSQLPFLPNSRRPSLLATIASQGQAAKWLYWWSLEYPDAVETAFTHRINSRGQLADLYRRQLIIASGTGASSDLLARIRSVTNELASVITLSATRERLTIEREKLEEQLLRSLPEVRPNPVTLDQVSAALPANGLLIEFQKYSEFLGDESRADQAWGDESYLAFLLQPAKKPQVISISRSSTLDLAIHQALFASASNLENADEAWEAVGELIFRPLKPYINNQREIFISSDGELSRVPFSGLPSLVSSTDLFARNQRLRLVSSGRDLIRFQQTPPPGQAPLIIANPSFTRDPNVAAVTAGKTPVQQRSGVLSQVEWDPLPGTATEGEQIAALLGTQALTHEKASVTLLERTRAPRILHIASHGFFVGDKDLVPGNLQHAILASNKAVQVFQGGDPLLRSGVVLAGANNPGLDLKDDGLLTAHEAVGLELDGTELVVLSACSTAQGDLRTGEGVFGLQRAFTVAGARSTLLSLWKVDDRATAELMTRFYRRPKAGEGRSDALAAVQEEFRNGGAHGPSGEDWSEPYYWAAWQLVGDWRPIEGL
ncbi:CHAT domain-containing protein [Cyanobium sp. LEGE 06113]|uniref:CHAT domain-containing protein n=1 Tax=Cyanobium sp. LEGE 06113 TaxID=1297573 RepID=UPI0018816165|nr:CHAT domain-containing protein [Cyanobium sp. LEGE 06113]MBE9153319.1 CHAT domain-containing protein [Cyanobium sp. LEGE 06113]